MKTIKLLLMMIGVGLSSTLFYSCLNDDDSYSLGKFWISTATVVPLNDITYYLRMDDGTTLWPAATDMPYYEPKENQRALVNFTILSDSLDGYDHYVKINRIDNYLTKNIAENKGAENDSIYGKDPIQVADIWVGDNYLNIYLKAYFGGVKKHFINLIPTDEENVDFELRHNAYDDPSPGYLRGELVAFKLDIPSDTTQTAVQDSSIIAVKVKTFDGDKVYKVKFANKVNASYAKYSNDVFLEGLN